MYPIVRNIQNDIFYKYVGNDEWINLHTKKKGLVAPEKAKLVFRFNIEATLLCQAYPELENMIHILKLKLENK